MNVIEIQGGKVSLRDDLMSRNETFKDRMEMDNRKGLSPFELYEQEFSNRRGDIVYISAPLTSAGYMDIKDIGMRVKANGEEAEIIVDLILTDHNNGIEVNEDTEFIFPHHIGFRMNKEIQWGEADYLIFWTLFILGINPKVEEYQDAKQKFIEEFSKLDKTQINDHDIDEGKREKGYDNLIKLLKKYFIGRFVRESKGNLFNPIPQIVFLPGWEESLGCRLEHEIIKSTGLRVIKPTLTGRNVPSPTYIFR